MIASKKAGADHYEISAVSVGRDSASRRRELKKLAKELNLGLTANGGFGINNDISSEEEGIRNRGIEDGKRIIEGLAEMGITSWSGINYGAWKLVPEPGRTCSMDEKQRVWERSVQSLKKLMETARDYQVTMCLEIVNRYEQFLINTVKEGVEMAQAVDSPFCRLLLDSYHMNIEEESFEEAIRFAADRNLIGEIHVSEPNRKVPGIGKSHMNWKGFFGGLNEIAYEGVITMEPFLIAGYPISSKICIWRDLSEQARSETFISYVKAGVDFVKGQYRRRRD